jgi:hypothetical protein
VEGLEDMDYGTLRNTNYYLFEFLNKSFFRGSRGAVFSKKAPLAAGGKKKGERNEFRSTKYRT